MHSPVVLVSTCNKYFGAAPYYATQWKYADAVHAAADCVPLLLPALGERTDWEAILSVADGVVLTGSPSNVHPDHFGQTVLDPSLPLDERRDATILPLIRAVLQRGIPLFAICRGAQEVNVALGGTLHQAVHDVADMMDHREDESAAEELRYGPAHRITLVPDGCMSTILGGVREVDVNSLHGQGIDRLAPGLVVEARADDGLVEAYRVAAASGFSLAVQWHPEWQATENPVSAALFAAFGAACRQYRQQHKQ